MDNIVEKYRPRPDDEYKLRILNEQRLVVHNLLIETGFKDSNPDTDIPLRLLHEHYNTWTLDFLGNGTGERYARRPDLTLPILMKAVEMDRAGKVTLSSRFPLKLYHEGDVYRYSQLNNREKWSQVGIEIVGGTRYKEPPLTTALELATRIPRVLGVESKVILFIPSSSSVKKSAEVTSFVERCQGIIPIEFAQPDPSLFKPSYYTGTTFKVVKALTNEVLITGGEYGSELLNTIRKYNYDNKRDTVSCVGWALQVNALV